MPGDRVAIYVTASDPQLAANQRSRMQQYADAMGWSVVHCFERNGLAALVAAADDRAFDRLLCWRSAELKGMETLLAELARCGVDFLALAQSCAALPE
jgi:hypothetical protein